MKQKQPAEHAKARHRIHKRKLEAADRMDSRENRTHEAQIKLLDKRLGKNKGAKKERNRLSILISNKDPEQDPSAPANKRKNKSKK